MWTLISRELRSVRFNIFVMMILTIIYVIATMIKIASAYGDHVPPIGISSEILSKFKAMFAIYGIFFFLMGTSQMIIDKKLKHSSFLCTLATSRRRIFLSRLISGAMCIILVVFLLSLTTAMSFYGYPRVVPLDVGYLIRIGVTFLCLSWMGYSVGLWSGWHRNTFMRVFVGMGVLFLVMSIVVFKGIGNESLILVSTISILALLRAWYKYSASSL